MRKITSIMSLMVCLYSLNISAQCNWQSYKNDTQTSEGFAGECNSFDITKDDNSDNMLMSLYDVVPQIWSARRAGMMVSTNGELLTSHLFGHTYKIIGTEDEEKCTIDLDIVDKEDGLFHSPKHYHRNLSFKKGSLVVNTYEQDRNGKVTKSEIKTYKEKGSCSDSHEL